MTSAHQIQLHLARANFSLTVDLNLTSNGITVIFGQSGSGKTSLLRAIAGLEPDCSGVIKIADAVWHDDAHQIRLPTWQRPIGFVFQEAGLFEHLNVKANIEFGWRRRQGASDRRLIDNAIELLQIESLLARPIAGLSGGERQRIAIARAVARQPQLMLFDEPLASIDTKHRNDILPWLERVRDQLAIPMLYVTHSHHELTRLAAQVVLLEHGQVRTQGNINDVLTALDTPLFNGDETCAVVTAQVVERDQQWHLMRVDFNGQHLWLHDNESRLGSVFRLRLLARDVSISVGEPAPSSIQNHLTATIDHLIDAEQNSQLLLRLRCGEHFLLARVTKRAAAQLQLAIGQTVQCHIKSAAILD